MHYTNILVVAKIETCTTQISYSYQRIKHMHYTNILQLAKIKTCSTKISYS